MLVFYPCVVSCTIGTKTKAKDVSFVGAIADQERAIRGVLQSRLSIIPAHGTPVPAKLQKQQQKETKFIQK